ncbi:trypsin-like peptidase domain-containing protein [Leptolyngbya sp. O-77]|uniref:trypsin-like peptidase domain-containing protein n=1 Tax=Leptolyngbya sp. O-77 TaxID=1080068 RepID=UPI00074D4A23|nr:trypsin-like peptidase domain-containing protein [Leptolyngbya sp. O-77]BAU41072.1 putative periplasmic serine endoprotease DegP-like precursor [Leptolyngbya sp. O-77]
MRLAPIAFSALAMLGFLDANRQANASPLSEGDFVEPIAPVETAAPAVPQPKAAIAPPEPIQTAPQARSTAPRPIEKAAQKAEKVAASAPSSQVTPPPAPAPERIAASPVNRSATPQPVGSAEETPAAVLEPAARPVAQRVEREAPVVAVAAVSESDSPIAASAEAAPPVRAIAPRIAEKQTAQSATIPASAATPTPAVTGSSAPSYVADATVERVSPAPVSPVEVSAPAEVTEVIVPPAVPVTFVEPTTPRISYSEPIPLLKDDPLNDPREFRAGSMHLETLPVVVSPATDPSLRAGATLTADASTLRVPDATSAVAESRSDRHEAAVRSCLGENPNLFRLVEREEGRYLSQVLYNGQPGRIARGSDGRLVCPDAVPVARTIETTPGVQVAAAPAQAPVAIAPVEAEVVTEGTSHRRHRYYYGYRPYYPPVVVSYPRPVVVERAVPVVVERPVPVVVERPVPVVVERPVPVVVERPVPVLLRQLPVLEIRYDRRTRRALRHHPYRLVHYHYPYYYPELAYGGWPYAFGLREENADSQLTQPQREAETLNPTHRFEGTLEAAAPAEITTLSVSTDAASVAIAPSGSRTAAPVYARANESVVAIRDRFSGSGFFVEPASGPGGNPNTLIVTNAHVVENLQQGQVSRVTLADNSDRRARLVGFDPSGTDLALLTLEPSRYPNLDRLNGRESTFTGQPLRLADTRSVQPGDPAYVIGTPFGQERFRNALTSGVVSKINPDEVLTDAQINPGNSGGPLLDQDGNVMGVVALSFARGGNRGLSSAISSDRVRHLLASAHTGHLATTAPLSRVTNATPLSFGQDSHGIVARAEGIIDGGDRLSDNGRRFETFSFQLPAPAQVSIQIRSAFDSFLALRRDVSRFNDQTALEPVAENDDANINPNARDAAIRANLPAGTYVVFAGSYGAGDAGRYDLSVRVSPQGTRVATPARGLAEGNAVMV